jgi:hypothetical protein
VYRCMIALLIALAGLAVPGGGAHAQEAELVEEQQMTLPAGRIFVQTTIEMSLSRDAALQPVSIAPDLWYGLTDIITIGLVHSGRAATGLLGGAGSGLCVTGSEGGCYRVYDNVGAVGRYHFYRQGDLTASAEGGVFAQSFDPFTLAIKAGALGRWQRGNLAAEVAPSVFVGLTQRDVQGGVAIESNKETLILPATVMFTAMPKLGVAAQAGLVLPFAEAADAYSVAVSIGAQYLVTPKILVDGAISLPYLVGGDALATGIDVRTFTLGVGYAH